MDRPDPSAVQTVADYTHALRGLKAWAGDPSFERLGRAANLPGSTLFDAVSPRRKRLPRLEVALKFVTACGVPSAELRLWESAWRSVSRKEVTGPQMIAVRREVPISVTGFAGRVDDFEQLDFQLANPMTSNVALICGTAGVGKSQLAIQWANRVGNSFADGQLYLDLRGYSHGDPIDAMTALGMLIRRLVPGSKLPASQDERVANYRSLTAGRSILLILDNVAFADQVRPLLPASPSSMAVITSRDSMAGLVARDGVRRIDLEALTMEAAVGLLQQLIGQRARFEEPATIELARRCARLPLALRLVAELAISRASTSLAELLEELDSGSLLDGLDAGGDSQTSLRAVMSWSRRRLGAGASATFDLLGLLPGGSFDVHAVAALTGATLPDARIAVQELVRSHLVAEKRTEPFVMHDLLRAFASELADELPPAVRRTAVRRLLDYYIKAAFEAHDRLFGYFPVGTTRPRSGPDTPDRHFASQSEADSWVSVELPNLVQTVKYAADIGFVEQVHLLATALSRFLDTRGYFAEAEAIHAVALDVSMRTGDREGEGRALNQLGRTYSQRGRPQESVGLLKRAIDLAIDTDDLFTQQAATANLGVSMLRLGQSDSAVQLANEALGLAVRDGNLAAQSTALAGLADAYLRLGDLDEARAHLQEASERYLEAGWDAGAAIVLESLGAVDLQLGDAASAIEHFTGGLDIARANSKDAMEVRLLIGLATAFRLDADFVAAEESCEAAMQIARRIGSIAQRAEGLQSLGDIAANRGDLIVARRRWTEAIALVRTVDVLAAEELTVRAKDLEVVVGGEHATAPPLTNVVLMRQNVPPQVPRGRCPDSAFRGGNL